MQEALTLIATDAATGAAEQLGSLAFGAIEKVLVSEITAHEDEGTAYFRVCWSVVAMGMEQDRICMVILPEFLEEEGSEGALSEQMTAYIVDKVLANEQEED